jgi:hypothetical protein
LAPPLLAILAVVVALNKFAILAVVLSILVLQAWIKTWI